MSFQAMTWAVAQKCGSAPSKLVLLMLANHTNGHTGQCNPSHKRLANECDMSVANLKLHLKKLSDMGLITIQNRFNDGVNLPNQYLLSMPGTDPQEIDGGGKCVVGVGSTLTGGGFRLNRGVGSTLATEPVNIEPRKESSLPTPSVGTGDAHGERLSEKTQPKRSPTSPACPYEKIIALYHQVLPEHQAVKVMNETRKGHIKARWVEVGSRLASMNRQSDEGSRLEWLERFFKRAANSDFLTGKVSRRDNGRPFFADLDFLFSPKGFAGVIEGKYENREVA